MKLEYRFMFILMIEKQVIEQAFQTYQHAKMKAIDNKIPLAPVDPTVDTKRMLEVTEDPKVVRTWRNNQVSSTILLSLPHDLAKKHGIGVHTNLLAIDTTEGILLKKLEIAK